MKPVVYDDSQIDSLDPSYALCGIKSWTKQYRGERKQMKDGRLAIISEHSILTLVRRGVSC